MHRQPFDYAFLMKHMSALLPLRPGKDITSFVLFKANRTSRLFPKRAHARNGGVPRVNENISVRVSFRATYKGYKVRSSRGVFHLLRKEKGFNFIFIALSSVVYIGKCGEHCLIEIGSCSQIREAADANARKAAKQDHDEEDPETDAGEDRIDAVKDGPAAPIGLV
mmetsp:Transcript_9147/g.12712  ORF Transcript_9147/g.12712 Transcript_9147/m.12712 type:complete len:166 (+) Transcript_9147:717-1214(+)